MTASPNATRIMDPLFRVELIAATPSPQRCIYAAMHQDYSEEFVYDQRDSWPDEDKAGEIIVKRLLSGGRGHYGCYSADTEVLTDSGWVPWPQVTQAHRLAAVDIKDATIQFEHPSAVQVFDVVEGDELYEVDSSKINFAVTTDHRMVVSKRRADGHWSDWQFIEASEVAGKAVRYLLAGHLLDRYVPTDCPFSTRGERVNLFKLAGFFFGDGCRSNNKRPETLRFRLRLERKIQYLGSLGFDVQPKKGDRYTINHPVAAAWIHEHFSSAEGKRIPPFVMHLPSDLLNAFLDGLRNSDGTNISSTWAYDSKEKASLDILQAALHLNGYRASLTLNNPNEGVGHENHAPGWRIHLSSREPVARAEFQQVGRTRGKAGFVPYTGKVYCATVSTGALLVRRDHKPIVLGNCLEHQQLVLNFGWFPHSVMQQARTHRIGVSFDVQSMRYTGQRIVAAAKSEVPIESVFYLRPAGTYQDRHGAKYEYSETERRYHLACCMDAAKRYAAQVERGMAEEHARGLIPFDVRQHFVASFTLRAALHFMDLRAKRDAQLEIQQMAQLMWPHIKAWVPAVAEWYEQARLGKAMLAP